VIDPVADIAAAASAAGVPCHVDACIGGWILPFLRQSGVDGPAFDFSIPGVTSISVDLHKYGYAPKGVSLLLHRDAELRRRHWFAASGWGGYPIVNPTLASSRPAGPMAAAWAVLRHLGLEGFRELAVTAHEAAARLAEAVAKVDGLRTVGAVDSTLVAIADDGGADDPDIRVVVDEVAARGWFLQVQPAHGSAPPTAHATITAAAAPKIDELVAVLDESAMAARAVGRAVPDPGLVAAAAQIDIDALTPEAIGGLLAIAGVDGDRLPERMAPLHALIEAIPKPLAERLLSEVLSRTLSPV
jgi:sphinganine-1-phosphate aldolase